MTYPLQSWYSTLDDLKDFFIEIKNKLTDIEIIRIELELDMIEEYITDTEHHQVSKKLIKLLQNENLTPINTDPLKLLNRMYDIAGFGCQSSCISSARIVLETEKLLQQESFNQHRFILAKGHMAPFLYAHEYTKSNFSLVYLYALHYSNIISPVLKEAYNAKVVDVFYNLGYGLGKVLSTMITDQEKKYVVLLGDSDLTFSATLEALMYIKINNINNITLLIDFNQFGFEKRPKDFDTTILNSFFDQVIEIDENELEDNGAFNDILLSSKRGAVFIHTKKENHRTMLCNPLYPKPLNTIKLTHEYAKTIHALNHQFQKELLIFTPDLASRFSLQEYNLNYINTAVSEVLTPILAIKQDHLTVIATDQKYATNMIGSILELYKSTPKVLLTLAKSWDYWGAEANALNILGSLPETTIFEPCTKEELWLLLQSHYTNSLYKTIISIPDMELPHLDFTPNLFIPNKLLNNNSKKVVISFGIATSLVYEVAQSLNIDLIHFAKMRMSYDETFQEELNTYSHVYLMEYNGRRNGFCEHFLSVYNLNSYSLITAQDNVPAMNAQEQIEYHGFSKKALWKILKN